MVTVTSPHHDVAVASPIGSPAYQGNLIRSECKQGRDGRFKTDEGDGGCPSAAYRFLKDVEQKIRPGNKRKRTNHGSYATTAPQERGWRVFIM
ncbi:Hypothetical predicted protein, partial [Paramuricea clavata]